MIGRSLKHYRITARLGEGGMGAVYVADDTELGREVALKVLPPEMASDADRLGRFKQEARAVAALTHPNIVTVYSVEETEGLHFITMELVRGRRLTELIEPHGLPLERMLELAVPVVEAVAAAHKRGVTHRDLKPDNVMVDDEGRPRVLDFGLAKIEPSAGGDADATVTSEGRVLGTVVYMSPEQAQGKTVGPASDVFSLGIILYELATGERPFKGDNNVSVLTSILRDAPPALSASAPRPVGRLDAIVARCLAKDPSDRYASAVELAVDLKTLQAAVVSGDTSISGVTARPVRPGGRRRLAIAGLGLAAVVAVASVAGWLVQRSRRVEWARTVAIPRIQELRDGATWLEWGTAGWEAQGLAAEAAAILGDDPALQKVWDEVTLPIDLTSEPPGAEVRAKAYSDPDGEWRHVGTTPLKQIRFPRGLSRVLVEAPGRRPVHDAVFNIGKFFQSSWSYRLHPEGELPDEMVFVPGEERDLMLPGVDHLEGRETGDVLLDRHEVTNREYKAFVDAGGYSDPSYWQEPFVDGRRTLSFEQAVSRFVDTTGRPGPAGWEVGDYPEGEDDLPASGVSWYEAAAYARWAGKKLPTIYHWNLAALTWASGSIAPLANFGSGSLRPVGESRSLNRYGAHDMAGNVREWVQNAAEPRESRFILGGGWNDLGWAFNDAYAQSPWDRQPTNGFRCMRELDERPDLAGAIEMPFRDFYAETPVDDGTFALFLRQFEYDPTPLNATIVSEDDQKDWTRQRVRFDAAYGGEQVEAWLYLPKTPPPHKSVIYFPGSGAIHTSSSANQTGDLLSFFMKSGRAVIFPIYKGTYERRDELDSDYPAETAFYKDHVIMWAKDLARSIDYLETLDDVDTSDLAFYGVSWGGVMGTILPAIEPRIRVNLLYVAGLLFQRAFPEVDQINYVGRVRQPTLMINGEFDFFFPLETSQKPLHDLLGAPEGEKKYVVYPGSHSVPRTELVRELLEWLDRWQDR